MNPIHAASFDARLQVQVAQPRMVPADSVAARLYLEIDKRYLFASYKATQTDWGSSVSNADSTDSADGESEIRQALKCACRKDERLRTM